MNQREIVFLSSVSQGLELYREAVYRSIEGLDGYHCLRMENFGARDLDSEISCKKLISESTMFVGILGHQYGSTLHNSGKSYSEMEYDAAGELGIPRLMFLAPADFPVQAHLIESDLMRERQRLFRERVKNDVQVDFFSSEDRLGRQVLQAIYNCRANVARENSPDVQVGEAVSCPRKTWLLFPFVINQAGFDTGFSIANVSLNPVSARPQAGDGILHFYGKNAPGAIDSSGNAIFALTTAMLRISTIGAGATYAGLISIIAPFFSGYIIPGLCAQ
jgi:Domain of unknown function (DUF4062)